MRPIHCFKHKWFPVGFWSVSDKIRDKFSGVRPVGCQQGKRFGGWWGFFFVLDQVRHQWSPKEVVAVILAAPRSQIRRLGRHTLFRQPSVLRPSVQNFAGAYST